MAPSGAIYFTHLCLFLFTVGQWFYHHIQWTKQIETITIPTQWFMGLSISIHFSIREVQLVHALVISRLDCYNCLLYGLSAGRLRKLQKVQNTCAMLICRVQRRDHVTPLLFQLHWLPMHFSANHLQNLEVDVQGCVHGRSATYLADLLQPYVPWRQLRSAGHEKLFQPFTKNGYGDHALSHVAPRLWNKLPLDIGRLPTLSAFKARPKPHFFKLPPGL